ncbi:Endoglucanase-4, partial [Lachnellula suecica]
ASAQILVQSDVVALHYIMLSTVALLGLISTVAAHGTVSAIVANGIFYEGYNPSYQYITPAPVTVGWKIPSDLANGFIAPDSFATSDVICHLSATNAMIAAPVKAGQQVELEWTPWPTSHKGPIIDYLANCNGPCETVDKTTLKWFKIDAVGLIDKSITDGLWATDQLIANNNTWTVTIPPTIAPGNYVLRHEIIALHSAGSANGAQDYPQCVNLAITSPGTDKPAGVLATTFYTPTDPGILFDLYGSFTSYTIPGPALYTGAVSITQILPAAPTASASGVYTV